MICELAELGGYGLEETTGEDIESGTPKGQLAGRIGQALAVGFQV
ncbi:MAG: hypothetical protein ACYSUC_10260 [Planctomycetota bacterium]